ncbi:hypothetical protein KAI32_03635 [Candidatus Pacearchaeota archaeon]|nr:hypothetical protein [Candidatus Pacearchaeota archaeon]
MIPIIRTTDLETKLENLEFVQVPKIGGSVAIELIPLRNYNETNQILQKKGYEIIGLDWSVEFFKQIKNTHEDIYEGIIGKGAPYRKTLLKEKFERSQGKLKINYNNIDKNEESVLEDFDKNTSIENQTIYLENFLKNTTGQGFPSKEIELGILNSPKPGIPLKYIAPKAGFVAVLETFPGGVILDCNSIKLNKNYWVRVAKPWK